MKNDFYQVALKVLIKNEKNEILVLKAISEGTYGGFYDLPGGRINEDEFNTPFIDILKREVMEEVGDLQIEVKKNMAGIGRHLVCATCRREIKEELHILYLFYEAKYLSGDVKISHEHEGYKWIKLEDVNIEEYFKSGILEGIKMYLGKN